MGNFHLLALGRLASEPSGMLWETRRPVEGPTWRGTEPPSQEPAPTGRPCEQAVLTVDPPAPEQK